MTPSSRRSGLLPVTSPRAHLHAGSAEVLEQRIAPATVSASTPLDFTYTDADGDLVHVHVSGTGTIDLLDAGGNDLSVAGALPANLATVVITSPSPDFSVSIADVNPGVGGDVVQLGKISGPSGAPLPAIRGIFTSDTGANVSYELTGFNGTTFTAGGGLRLHGTLAGDADPDTGSDLHLTSIPLNTSVFLRDGIAAGATAVVDGNVAGSFEINGTDSGDLTLGAVSGGVTVRDLASKILIKGNLSGRLVTGDPTLPLPLPGAPSSPISGTVEVAGNITGKGSITAHEGLDLTVGKNVVGLINVAQSLELQVAGNLSTANILVGDNMSFSITGGVVSSSIEVQHEILPGSQVDGQIFKSALRGNTGLSVDIGLAVKRSRLSSGSDDLSVTVGGSVRRSQMVGGGFMDLTVGGRLVTSSISPDGALNISVNSDVVSSIISSKSSNVDATFLGSVLGSRLFSGDDLNISVGKAVSIANINAGGSGTVVTQLGFTNVDLSVGEIADLTIGGAVRTSTIAAGNDVALIAGKGLSLARVESTDGSINADITGALTSSFIDSGEDLTVTVRDLKIINIPTGLLITQSAGRITSGTLLVGGSSVDASTEGGFAGNVVSGGDVNLATDRTFSASVNTAGNLSIQAKTVGVIGSSLGSTKVISTLPGGTSPLVEGGANPKPQAGLYAAGDLSVVSAGAFSAPMVQVGGNVTDFQVAKNLKTKMYVSGNFIVGTATASATVVGGAVSASSLIHIGGDVGSIDSAPKLLFGKVQGTLEIDGRLLTDLDFAGDVRSLNIAGGIGPAKLGDTIADIVVHGKLQRLTAGTLFERTDDNSGIFRLDPTVATIGTLLAEGGALKVLP